MFSYAIPSKTFLLGEYVALNGGPALVYASAPLFELTLIPSNETAALPFHPESPAGRYYRSIQAQLPHCQMTFTDPHNGQGGLGASSAQFIALYTVYQRHLDPQWSFSKSSIPALLDAYKHCAWNGEGLPPSGYDVIAQAQGNLCFIDNRGDSLQTCHWPFTTLDIYLLRTGKKLATHEHLQTLNNIDSDQLKNLVYAARRALDDVDDKVMIQAVNAYADQLLRRGMCASHTQKMLMELQNHPACLAVKGCGAMGADVVLCLVDSNQQQNFSHWLSTKPWKLITSSFDASVSSA